MLGTERNCFLVVQSGALLGTARVNLIVRRGLRPDDVVRVAGVVAGVASELLGNVCQRIVLPARRSVRSATLLFCSFAFFLFHVRRRQGEVKNHLPDQNVSVAIIILDGVLDALGVVPVTRQVHVQAQVPGEGKDSLVRSRALPIYAHIVSQTTNTATSPLLPLEVSYHHQGSWP